MRHELKCWPGPFADVVAGLKTYEVRKNDRGFKEGDVLWLRCWSREDGYNFGRSVEVDVTHITTGWGLPEGICVLGIKLRAPVIDANTMETTPTEATSGELDALQEQLGSEDELAYEREPTQDEGNALEHWHLSSMGPAQRSGECFVDRGGWTGRRCNCGRWVWFREAKP